MKIKFIFGILLGSLTNHWADAADHWSPIEPSNCPVVCCPEIPFDSYQNRVWRGPWSHGPIYQEWGYSIDGLPFWPGVAIWKTIHVRQMVPLNPGPLADQSTDVKEEFSISADEGSMVVSKNFLDLVFGTTRFVLGITYSQLAEFEFGNEDLDTLFSDFGIENPLAPTPFCGWNDQGEADYNYAFGLSRGWIDSGESRGHEHFEGVSGAGSNCYVSTVALPIVLHFGLPAFLHELRYTYEPVSLPPKNMDRFTRLNIRF